MPTGLVEVYVREIEVLGPAGDLPLPVFGDQPYPEETRLKYRFLDLRREQLHKNIMLRGRIIDSLAPAHEGAGLLRVPDADPDRLEPGRRARLSGAVAPASRASSTRCRRRRSSSSSSSWWRASTAISRSRPASATRTRAPTASPGEFYQLDVEMSFVTQEDVFAAVEPVLARRVRGVRRRQAGDARTFPRIPYAEAMLKYGVDKPDLRNPIVIADVTEVFARDDVTSRPSSRSSRRAASCARSRRRARRRSRARSSTSSTTGRSGEGAPGLGYIVFEDEGEALAGKGPIAKFLPPRRSKALVAKAGLEGGRCGVLRLRQAGQGGQARRRGAHPHRQRARPHRKKDVFEFCWIVDFPMYEWNEEEKKIDFSHNPFSMPQGGLEALETQGPARRSRPSSTTSSATASNCRRARSATIAPTSCCKAFEIAGYGEDVLEEKFGGMYRAFHYGAPPHGGIAPGIDRIVMLLAGEENLREVMLFPMNQQAEDLMMGAPAPVTPKQLRELHIRLVLPEK